ncbi:MAG: GGDEF domain-containing protein [Leptospiraceae bacterium]|nr:GGDEF domain-containing protein [Leptospiraceae bacterium]
MARDITERKRLQQELEHAAHYDSLTSLPNRALILDHFKNQSQSLLEEKVNLPFCFRLKMDLKMSMIA